MLSSSFSWNFPRKTRKKDAQSFHLIAREYESQVGKKDTSQLEIGLKDCC
jgi:hypothetical protein